jgi:2',3'-cyclic-nucleotide 2'-phosphodiesterase (5'-nucleotidase family)
MKKTTLISLLMLTLGLFACTPQDSPEQAATFTAPMRETVTAIEATIQPEETPAPPTPEGVTLTILYTNDEHGWMSGQEEGQGAAEIAGLWATAFSESDAVLPVSGGDNWTGPAISTWFQGESMVEVMNTMGYAASAIGNHEFDFGLDVLAARIEQAGYPYLGANIRYKASGEIPTDLGIQPYTLVDAGGIQVGIIGLSNVNTPSVTNPAHVGSLDFTDYADALREYVPEVRAAGADLIIVPSHLCEDELTRLANEVADLGIAFFGGGHCHETFAREAGGAVLLESGAYLRNYAYLTLTVNPQMGDFTVLDYGTEKNVGGIPQPQVAEIIAHWQELTDEELDVPIGYLENEIPKRSDEMAALITESWLWAYPAADVAITNWGGMRDRIPAGEITYADIISVMPFENVLIDVTLTGDELEQVLYSGRSLPAVGGMHREGSEWILNATGAPLDPEATYHLLVNDFMYAGGDDYEIAKYDPDAYNTAINWRQPVIDWILTQDSSPENPLDAAVDDLLP